MSVPKIKPHDWITVGSRDAVVCNILEQSDLLIKVEIVYLDDRDRAINENAIWKSNRWNFESDHPTGGYADNYERLVEFVSQLRLGRYSK